MEPFWKKDRRRRSLPVLRRENFILAKASDCSYGAGNQTGPEVSPTACHDASIAAGDQAAATFSRRAGGNDFARTPGESRAGGSACPRNRKSRRDPRGDRKRDSRAGGRAGIQAGTVDR